MKKRPNDPRLQRALEVLNLHHESFFAVAPIAASVGHPVPVDTRGWSQILVSVLCGLNGLARKKGADLEDGSDVKAANTWEAIDTPRFNGVLKAGTQAEHSGRIESLNAMPFLFLVLWDHAPVRGHARCRIWVVRTQRDKVFRAMCESWYEQRKMGKIRSNNFQLHPPPSSLDIVCHSRGGLVARWFCEGFSDSGLRKRTVLVGSPLGGTSLAAPARIRSVLDMLGNVADVLRHGTDWVSAKPLFMFASGLLRVFSAVADFTSNTPMVDAAMALVPGLDAQSKQGNNEELRRLRANTGHSNFQQGQIQYFAIKANFEPNSPGWNFLQYFSKPLHRIANFGADIIFENENDLVVDTSSMWEVADNRQIAIAHDFGTTDEVHHLNYFRQIETIQAIRRWLQIL